MESHSQILREAPHVLYVPVLFCFFKFSNKCCTAACARLLFGFRGFDEVYCTFTFLEGRYTTWCPQRSFYLQHTFLEGIVWDA
jgi:hypothetical protein